MKIMMISEETTSSPVLICLMYTKQGNSVWGHVRMYIVRCSIFRTHGIIKTREKLKIGRALRKCHQLYHLPHHWKWIAPLRITQRFFLFSAPWEWIVGSRLHRVLFLSLQINRTIKRYIKTVIILALLRYCFICLSLPPRDLTFSRTNESELSHYAIGGSKWPPEVNTQRNKWSLLCTKSSGNTYFWKTY